MWLLYCLVCFSGVMMCACSMAILSATRVLEIHPQIWLTWDAVPKQPSLLKLLGNQGRALTRKCTDWWVCDLSVDRGKTMTPEQHYRFYFSLSPFFHSHVCKSLSVCVCLSIFLYVGASGCVWFVCVCVCVCMAGWVDMVCVCMCVCEL